MRRRGTVWKRGDGQYVARLRVGGLSFYGPTRPTRLEAEKDIPELAGRVDNGEGQTLLDYATEYLQGPYGDSITEATKSRAESTLKNLARTRSVRSPSRPSPLTISKLLSIDSSRHTRRLP